jgi:hypothetical protein
MLWPFARLRYAVASALWEILGIAALIVFAIIWPHPKRWQVWMSVCWSLPAFMAFAEGQDVAILLAIIAIGARLQHRRPLISGFAASLCAIKLHLFIMLPVWIVNKRRWRFASGLLAGGGALLALSFISQGFAWPAHYYRFMTDAANDYSPGTDVMPNLRGLFAGLMSDRTPEIVGTIAIAAAIWFASLRSSIGFAASLVGGILAAPHDYMHDCTLLIPAMLIIPAESKVIWPEPWRCLC